MKKTALTAALLVFASALLLSSCDAMFNTNLFKAAGLGQVDITKASTPAEIAAAATSPQFFTDLKSDATTKDNMLTTLVPGYSSGTVPTAIDLQAALTSGTATADNLVLASAIMINTTEAGTIVKNIAQELPSIASTTTTLDVSAVIKAILPADVLSDPVAFSNAITALSDASSSLTAVANYVGASGTLPSVPGGTSQDTAYYGLVALAVSSVTPTTTSGYASTADALYAIVNGNAPASVLNPPDAAVFDMNSSTSTASILLSAAGIDLAALAQ
ncbi:MAG TPA: hypothetical protein VMV83_10035 [Rectinemataceae bacterium]|nr:hypothetical protein [Rectinemataceae bacterium]